MLIWDTGVEEAARKLWVTFPFHTEESSPVKSEEAMGESEY